MMLQNDLRCERRRLGLAALCAFLVLIALGSSPPLRAAQPDLKAFQEAQGRSVAVAERIRAATVGIINSGLANSAALGEGSGVVVSEDGLILTVGHVLGKGKGELTVVFPDGRRANAKPLGADFSRDAGMAKITDPGKWPHVEMGRIEDVKPGQWCIAVGHPGGIQLNRTPPLRLGRVLSLPAKDSPMRFLLSDATVISGDSGGPLFDLDGKVIAIHSNIGLGVTENRHVPIDIYREKWQDFLAGKQTGDPARLGAGPPRGPAGQIPDVRKFAELLRQQVQAGDPEALALVKGGQVTTTPEQMAALIAKWEKKGKPQPAASGTIDVLKFQRLLQDRLVAGDAEVRGLIRNGAMPLSMEQMQSLMNKWDPSSTKPETKKKEPERTAGAKIQPNPRTMADLLKYAKPQGNGQYELHVTPENAKEVMGLMKNLGMGMPHGLLGDPKAGKAHPELLKGLEPLAAAAGKNTVSVLCDGKPAVLGTVVRKNGFILTKASELHGKVSCKIGDRELPATIVKQREDFDLALLKVEADGLTPVTWNESNLPLGSWLLAADAAGKPMGVGILGIPSRGIAKAPTMLLRNKAVIGAVLDQTASSATIDAVAPAGPAEKAGLRKGDIIAAINGKAIANAGEVIKTLGDYKPGDKLRLDVKRGGQAVKAAVELMASEKMQLPSDSQGAEKLSALSQVGGSLSKRKSDFPAALTHDIVLQAPQCGGPLLDLEGRAVGLNIARVDRTATYAIPAAALRTVIADLLSGLK